MRNGFIILVLCLTIAGIASAQQAGPLSTAPMSIEPIRVKTGWLFGKTYLIYSWPDVRQKRVVDPLADLTPSQLAILEKLNRVTAAGLKRQKTLVMPEDWADDDLAYSPFPKAYGWAADKPKVIVVDRSMPWQSVDYLKTGIVLRDAPSTAMMSCRGLNGASARSPRRTIR